MLGHSYRKESGAIVLDGRHVASTQQCVHCGSHERVSPGSGKKRGWCMHCGGFVCGRPNCMKYCVPHEARIEYEEALNIKKEQLIERLLTRYPAINKVIL